MEPAVGLRAQIESGIMGGDRSVEHGDATRRGRRARFSAPAWIADDLIASTLKTWQPFYKKRLTRSDAIEMLLAAGNLIDCLEPDDEQALPGAGPRLKSRAGA